MQINELLHYEKKDLLLFVKNVCLWELDKITYDAVYFTFRFFLGFRIAKNVYIRFILGKFWRET